VITGDLMPKLRGVVSLPSYVRGMWQVESPIGTKVYSESFPENVLSYDRTFNVSRYSALVLVNGGLSVSETPAEHIVQKVYVAVTPGVVEDYSQKFKTKVTLHSATGLEYANRLRTKVSIS